MSLHYSGLIIQLPVNGERDACGDRKLSQRWPRWGPGWFLFSSDTSHRGNCSSPWFTHRHLTQGWAKSLLITGMLDRGYLFFLFLSELSQEELLKKQSQCEQDQLNYHKQQGDGGGETPKARSVITSMELSSANRQHTSGLAEMVRLTGGLMPPQGIGGTHKSLGCCCWGWWQ